MSELDTSKRESVLEASLLLQEAKVSDKKSLLAQLDSKPKHRLGEEDSQLRPGVRDIAVALGAPDTIHATVAVAHLTHRANALSINDIRQRLMATAGEIEQRLGLNP